MAKIISSIGNSSITKTSQLINDGENSTSEYVEFIELGDVAISNDYNDLDNIPATFIPSPHTHIVTDISGNKSQFNNSLIDGDFLFVGDVSETPDATTSTKGKLKLAGDLGGTADLPTVPNKLDKGGYTGSAQNLKDSIDDIYQPDTLISTTTPTRVGDTFTFPALGYTAVISKTVRQNPTSLVTTIATATTDYKRTDLIYFNSSNVLVKIVGTESLTVAVRPDVPAGSVGVSFINVFGATISTPTPIDNTISVQDSLGVEQFKMTNYVRFKGVTFNSATKMIDISPLSANTAFVDTVLGNNTTAELENSKKPFASIDGVFARYTADQSATAFVRIYLVKSGTYAWNNKIYNISFELYSDKVVTIDMTASAVGSIFINTNVALKYTAFLNLPLGTLYNNKGTSDNGKFGHEDYDFIVNIQTIYWNATGSIFNIIGNIIVQNLTNLSTAASFSFLADMTKTSINIAVLTILPLAASVAINCKYGITVSRLILSSSSLVFKDGEVWNIGNITGTLNFSYTHNTTFKINFLDSVITGGINFNNNDQGNITFSGNIKSTYFSGQIYAGRADRIGSMTWINFSIENLASNGIRWIDGYVTIKCINCYVNQTAGSWLFSNVNIVTGACVYNIEKTTLRQTTAGTLFNLNSNNLISAINIGGFESNCLSITDINNSPVTYDLMSFKDKKREQVVRSKVDLIGRVLNSQTNYIIDGVLTLLTGEYIEVPLGGLTITGYGFDVSQINKNVSGQSIFKSPATGGSGNVVSKDIQYNSGLGSVFNITDSDGSHAIELNDVNFQSCASLGTLSGYRQFTGTTCGFYSLSDGVTMEGNWSGFKLTNSNVIDFGSLGTLFKKGTATVFSNRFYIDLNLSVATSSKICDFSSANFTNDKSLQVVNCYTKVNGVIDPSLTSTLFPNITETNSKSYFVNNIGIKNSNQTPYGLSTQNMLTYTDDTTAAAGGIVQIGDVYIVSSTGLFKVRQV